MNRIAIIREATSKVVKMLAEKNVEITQRGTNAFVRYDDRTGRPVLVNIPYIPDNASEELLNAIQGFVDHEVAHILFSDFEVLKEAKRLNVSGIYGIVEDSFIERKMARQFTGSGLNLRNVGEFFLKTFTEKKIVEDPENKEIYLIVPAVRAWAGQSVYIDYMKDKWHLMQSMVDALGDSVKDVAKCESSRDCLNVAVKFDKLLNRPKPPKAPKSEEKEHRYGPKDDKGRDDKDSDSADSDDSKDESKPEQEEKSTEERGDSLDDNQEDEENTDNDPDEGEGSDDSGSGEGDKEDESDDVDSSSDDSEPSDEFDNEGEGDVGGDKSADDEESDGSSPSDEVSEGDASEGADGDDGGFSEPASEPMQFSELERKLEEADYDKALSEAISEIAAKGAANAEYLIYTKDFDRVEPLKAKDSPHLERQVKAMQDGVDHMVGPLQKDLERIIAARSKSVWSNGHRSGRLNASSLARLVAFNDDRVFRRRHESNSLDVAVSLLIDCSGSMTLGSEVSKIRTAAYAGYALSSVLERIKIHHEVLGFTTGRDIPDIKLAPGLAISDYARTLSLYMPIIKSFNERVSPETKRRFASLVDAGWLNENVDGECVEIAAQRLTNCKQTRKILIVLSDGQPACVWTSATLNDHLKKVVRNIEKSGIDVLGIGIQTSAVEKFYSKHLVLNDISKLPETVIGEMKRLLMKA